MREPPRPAPERVKPCSVFIKPHREPQNVGDWRELRPVFVTGAPPCSASCPAGEQAREYIALALNGRMADAWHKIMEDNPLPAITGRICYHRCEDACHRSKLDQAIGIHNIERRIGDYGLEQGLQVDAAPARNEEAAVIGSGPAGLSAAYHLVRKGYKVMVYEAGDQPGGMLRHGIPSYRLPRKVLEGEIQRIADLGVTFVYQAAVGRNMPWDKLKSHKAVVISAGCTQGVPLNIPGEESRGVVDGLAFLRLVDTDGVSVGKKVIVIGGGNLAMECARTALRLGAKQVTVVCPQTRKDMSAQDFEVKDAEDEGVTLTFLASPVSIRREKRRLSLHLQRMQMGEPEKSGSRRSPSVPIPGDEFDMPADTVLVATGQQVDLGFLPEGVRDRWQTLAKGEAVQINGQWIISAGDLTSEPSALAHAIGSGKRAAALLDGCLQGQELPAKPRPKGVRFDSLSMEYFISAPRQEPPVLEPARRVKGFDEVVGGLSDEALLTEAKRCFHCGDCNFCGNCWIFCPEMAITKAPDSEGPNGLPRYRVDYRTCKGCGICAHECPRAAITMEKEVS